MKDVWSTFEDYINNLMEKEHIPGVAVAVYQKGDVIYQKGFGYRNIETKELVTPETIFGIASVTKSFTAAAILQLEHEGKLNVDDPVIQYIPELIIPGFANISDIKIHHLLSHTTGLPPIERKEEINCLEDHLTYLSTIEVKALGKPGEFFSYSNDAFLLLGLIIERVTGWLFRRFITHQLLDCLNMHRSTMSLEELGKLDNVSVPYNYDKRAEQYEVQEWPKLGNYEVGGGIRSNVLDLLKYGQLFINSPVQEKYLAKMRAPVHKVFRHTSYGYALLSTPYNGITLVEHSGGQAGVSSNFGLVPEEDIVVAVLSNVTGAPASDIWLAAINTILGLPINEKAWIEPEYEMSSDEEERFIGIYESQEGGKIEISLSDGGLLAFIDSEIYHLRASDAHTLVIKEWEYPVSFYFDKSGRAWTAFFGMRMLKRAAKKTE